ncbi:MAG: hypothetical protein LQ338_002520 [Usnochroma carphineum]|nr:MAG: hypothetical protein LQ338_002520 [Usnochroma carphineum]
MPLLQHRPLPPLHELIVPPAPALVTLSTATAPSPALSALPDSTVSADPSSEPTSGSSMPRRWGSKRMERIKELLTPTIKGPDSPSRMAGQQVGKGGSGTGAEGSQIHFFERHPLDSRNPLTFLDGGSGDGGSGGGTVGSGNTDGEIAGGKREATTEVIASFDFAAASSPPRPIPGTTTNPNKYASPCREEREVLILRARPATLLELPGRFRSTESCWYCADWRVGAMCGCCGLVVRRTSDEKY